MIFPTVAGVRPGASIWISAWWVGIALNAEFVQREFHEVFGENEPRSRDHQLDNEPVVNVAYKHDWIGRSRVGRLDIAYGPRLGFALWNL